MLLADPMIVNGWYFSRHMSCRLRPGEIQISLHDPSGQEAFVHRTNAHLDVDILDEPFWELDAVGSDPNQTAWLLEALPHILREVVFPAEMTLALQRRLGVIMY